MSSNKHAEVLKAADGFRKKDDISLIDVLTLAETSIRSMKTFIDSLDSTIYREFRDIAEYIQNIPRSRQNPKILGRYDAKIV